MSALKELVTRSEEIGEKRTAAEAEMAKIAKAVRDEKTGEDRDLSAAEEIRSDELIAELKGFDKELDELDKRVKEETKKEKRSARLSEAREMVQAGSTEAGTEVEVVDEPMVYGEGSPQSYVGDLCRYLGGPSWQGSRPAQGRLELWAHQVERDIALNDATPRSKGALMQVREYLRGERRGDVELEEDLKEVRRRGRASLEEKRTGIATGGGATASASGGGGAAFVTPVFYVSDYAPYREFGRQFIDACNGQPLPPYGMNVYMPHVTRGVKVESQVEGEAVAEQTPEAGYLTGALKTLAGEVIVSQQLLDRAGPNFQFDRLVFDQLNRRYALEADTFVLKETLAVATEQSWEGKSEKFDLYNAETEGTKVGGFVGQIAKAKASVRTTAGTVLNPTHLFLRADRWEQIAAWTNKNGNPVVNPGYSGVFQSWAGGNSSGDEGIEGDTGYRLLGLPAFTDQNIPTKGTTGRDQAIVGDLQEVYVYEGNLVPRVIPQTYAQNLQVLLQLYAYITVIVRYEKAIVAISGKGMSTIEYTN